MTQSHRVCQVQVGKPGSKGRLIEGLRTVFTVTKTSTHTPNVLDLEIYNLAEPSRVALSEPGVTLWLRAGYSRDAGPEIVFTGNPRFVTHTFPAPDVITKVESYDGQRVLAETLISESFEAGTPVEQVLGKIAKKFDIPIRPMEGIAGEFMEGASFVGPAKDALDAIARKHDLEWSIQNGELQVIRKRGSNQKRAIVLNPASGLLGSPEKINDPGTTILSLANLERWRVRCLLQPRLEPGNTVIIESMFVQRAQYVIESVQHTGDTHGDAWETIIEVFAK